MKIEFTGRRTDVPEELRKLAERKLAKLGRVLPGVNPGPRGPGHGQAARRSRR
jgi:ribosome-associated translation inhibitor RaiA